MTRKTVYLNVKLMEEIAHKLATDFFAAHNEPIPDFANHDEALLDSALSLAMVSYGGIELYPTLEGKAVAMFYSIIKNHPFPNGNKRIGTAALLVFLYLNGHWVKGEQWAIYRFAVKIARSRPKDRDWYIRTMTGWLGKRLIDRHYKIDDTGLMTRILNLLGRLVPRFWRRWRGR